MILKGGHETQDPRLDRVPSKTDEHIVKYPLTVETMPDKPTPMAIGVNWYSAFDSPIRRGNRYYVENGDLGHVRGGHCVCIPQRGFKDLISWWVYYNQQQEGRCVQFGTSRMMSLLNRRRYEIRPDVEQGRWLYWEAQREDEWEGGSYPGASPQYEGTSVNAALKVIQSQGIIPIGRKAPHIDQGISAFRWATSDDDIFSVTGWSDGDYVPVLNSWGRDGYPHIVWFHKAVIARLRAEGGEFGVVTDR